jgi:hypothetical protein
VSTKIRQACAALGWFCAASAAPHHVTGAPSFATVLAHMRCTVTASPIIGTCTLK